MPWLLNFTSPNVNALTGDGRPWADGTEMALRAQPGAPNPHPWDDNCRVATYVDGMAAMSAMRDALETVIANANAPGGPPVGLRGHVYITDWRFNCLRDLSVNNPWGTDQWGPGHQNQANSDQTAIGLVVRLLQAGVIVRIMVWLPTWIQQQVIGAAHIEDHFLAAKIVQFESNRLTPPGAAAPLGVVALDARTASITVPAASHHQKMMVIRSLGTNVAFVGGVDLAYTRRSDLTLPSGDWQSGNTIPDPAQWWPRPAGVNYAFQAAPAPVPAMATTQATDLPANVYGDSGTPAVRQMWHDQHLKLEGPVVATIEHQFRERWVDQADSTWQLGFPPRRVPKLSDLNNPGNLTSGQVVFSTALAYNANGIVPLPVPAPIPLVPPPALPPPPGTQVQMWRTIPLRSERTVPPFVRGEFTVMAGIANAVQQAQELIWMYDQYFWSQPLARLLNARLQAVPGLRVILILPPFADTSENDAHLARKLALQALTGGGVANRVGVYNMWYQQPPGNAAASNRGIYVHAKSHTYDNSLLVCGSANLNRRSFLCDTELACAVLDTAAVPTLVPAHQQLLWTQLFPATPWPANINRAAAGWGALFFTQFQTAHATASHAGDFRLITDPWALNGPLPNGVVRPVAGNLLADYDTAMDPSSVMLSIEKGWPNILLDLPLDQIVTRLENTPDNGTWPWRKW
jgi:phosphatidylserine/phosphatidylglycerophosphate/cardiolipin synthase-like enzyme